MAAQLCDEDGPAKEEAIPYEQLREERDRYRKELEDMSERLKASAGIVQHGLLKKFAALEEYIQKQKKTLKSEDCACHTVCHHCGQTCCVADSHLRPVHCGSRSRYAASSASLEGGTRRRGLSHPVADFQASGPSSTLHNGNQRTDSRLGAPYASVANSSAVKGVRSNHRCRMTSEAANLNPTAGSKLSEAAARCGSQQAVEDTNLRVETSHQTASVGLASDAFVGDSSQPGSISFDFAAADCSSTDKATAESFDLAAADCSSTDKTTAESFDLAAADSSSTDKTTAESFDLAAADSSSTDKTTAESFDLAAADCSSTDKATAQCREPLTATPSVAAKQRSLWSALSDSQVLFSFNSLQAPPIPVFPSLPDSRLASLGLLPASMAELDSANASVSIVDPNSRYRTDSPAPTEDSPAAAEAGGGASEATAAQTEERIRELAISFANDAATMTERIKRAALARASQEANFQEEMERLQELLASLASMGAGETAAEAGQSARLLASIGGGLSRTAETFGALQQECRLNFAFHLIHKHSEETRAEKERMFGELELLRQAVEDERFYDDADSSLSKYARLVGGDPAAGLKAKAKFQQLGRNVARTTSVTSLLQKLSRERERRRKQRQEGVDEADRRAEENQSNDPADSEHWRRANLSASESVLSEEDPDQTVLDRLDKVSMRLFADRRIRLFLAPLTLLIAVVCLLWAIAYPIVKRLATG